MFVLTTCLILSLFSYIFLGLLIRGNIQSIPTIRRVWQPTVTIVVAAKNEEHYLGACLTSLSRLEYPSEKLNIVVVDDASTDGSGDIIDSFAAKVKNISHIKLKNGDKEKSGKAGALLVGIEKSHGEIIFITDADCTVPPHWIRTMLTGFGEQVGVVGGFTLLQKSNRFFAKLQAMDWLYLLSVASAASQLNKPITWVGNNLAVRRAAYEKVGGYRNLDESFVEDFALIDAIERQTDWQSRFYASSGCIVRTHAAESLAELYSQRRRWTMGVFSARPFGLWLMFTGFLTPLFLYAMAVKSLPFAIIAGSIKLTVDYLVCHKSCSVLEEHFQLYDFLWYELYYSFYVVLLPIFMLIDRRITWKGAHLPRR